MVPTRTNSSRRVLPLVISSFRSLARLRCFNKLWCRALRVVSSHLLLVNTLLRFAHNRGLVIEDNIIFPGLTEMEHSGVSLGCCRCSTKQITAASINSAEILVNPSQQLSTGHTRVAHCPMLIDLRHCSLNYTAASSRGHVKRR